MKAEIQYDELILKSAILAYIKRVYLRHLLWPTFAATALLVGAFFLDFSWLQSFIVVVVILIPSVVILGYWMRIRHSFKILDMLDDGKVEVTVSDEGVATNSAIGQSLLKWTMFADLWDTPDSKLLIYTNNQFMTLPKKQVSEAFFEAITQRIKKS